MTERPPNLQLVAGSGQSWQLPIIDTSRWHESAPPCREFVVQDWLVRGTAALLSGADGVGKSLLAQQLATCVQIGFDFLGLPTAIGSAVYITCEDDADELWRRQRSINTALGLPDRVAPAIMSSLVGAEQIELCYYDQANRFHLSPAALGIVNAANAVRANLIILDNLAHFFPGNENVRHEVAMFCQGLERMALMTGATVLMLAHPPKAGAEYSGSTGWSARVRQRWYFERPDAGEGTPDRDARTLRKSKANYAEAGTEVACRWHEWAFVRQDAGDTNLFVGIRATAQATAENEAFLRCLDAATERRQCVSHNQGVNYAPNVFVQMPEGKGFKVAAFKLALQRLLSLGAIELDRRVFQRDNRVWKYGIRRTEGNTGAHQAAALTRRTEPHQPNAQAIENACTKPHAPSPIDTTYLNGGSPMEGFPHHSDDDIDWGEQ